MLHTTKRPTTKGTSKGKAATLSRKAARSVKYGTPAPRAARGMVTSYKGA